ncbi:MAG: single-stranded DNA-binding protein [Planctomycetes bacterium]|nr:single-stranded DNA-binding protein [Planctomycetota bacterium]
MPLMLNTVQIAGNLTRDPELKTIGNSRNSQNNSIVANMSLAINRRYKGGDGEMKEETCFVDVEVWGRQAELVGQYLQKGRNCMVEGALQFHQWTDQADKKQSRLRVKAQRVHFLGQESGSRIPPSEQQDQAARHAVPALQQQQPQKQHAYNDQPF